MPGRRLQHGHARLKLKPGQEVYAEAGKMLYKTANVSWETRMSGDSLGQKIWGALKRKVITLLGVPEDRIRFQPANSNMAPIIVRKADFKSVDIIGIVVGVYRKL